MMLFVIFPSVSWLHAQWLVYISLHVDAFQTHCLPDLNVHNNVPGSNFQFVSMFPVCFVICSQYGFGNPLQLLGPINFIQESAAKNFNQETPLKDEVDV
jgi:hypothetical protein